MCAITTATAAAYTLAISAATLVTSVGMGVYSAQQQAQQARAQQSMQMRQMQQQQQMQSAQMMQSSQMQQMQMTNQMRNQQRQALQSQQQHHANAMMQQSQLRQQQDLQRKTSAQQMDLQRQQANARILNQYSEQKRQVINQRAQIMAQNQIERLSHQQQKEEARDQVLLNNEAANRAYVAEQGKLNEVRQKALFEQQNILAKSIGSKGSILATGRAGQSIGLLLQDVDRQAGFAEAQENASLDSARDHAIIAMDSAWLQNQSQNNKAAGSIGFNPDNPYLPEMPDTPSMVGLGIANPFA